MYGGIAHNEDCELDFLPVLLPETPRTLESLAKCDVLLSGEMSRWRTRQNVRILDVAGKLISDEVWLAIGGRTFCPYKSAHRMSANAIENAFTVSIQHFFPVILSSGWRIVYFCSMHFFV